MKLRLLLLSLVSILALVPFASAVPVAAQTTGEPAALENVTLWLYPEYDDPRLLVMIEGDATGAALPATIRFLVPAGAEMYSAGSRDAQGDYSGGPPNRKSSDIPGWDEISYQLPNPTFRMEYYADQIRGLPDKRIAYDFYTLYSIRNLKVVVQQPLKASGLSVTPNGTAATEGNFQVQILNYSNLAPDPAKPLHVDITYNKADLNPSLQNPGLNPTVNAPAPSGGISWPLVILLVAAAVVIAGIFFWLGTSRRAKPRYAESQPEARPLRKGGRQIESQNRPTPPRVEQSVPRERRGKTRDFCDQCGANLDRNDRFCPSCGAKLE